MWRIIRPDAINALENPLIKKILPRYVGVVKNELLANFQIAKRVTVSDRSWSAHKKGMKNFRKLKNQLEKKAIKIENLEIPKFSLMDLKIELTRDIMKACELCERRCRVNRLNGEIGECRVGNRCLISSEFTHMGEEPHIVPSHTIFFMGCNFHCQYCQNWTISQWFEAGVEVTSEQLAKRIEERRSLGCRNVNFVGGSPTPSLLWILEALNYCRVNVPVIWNSNMYMSTEVMEILDGIVDVYLSDFKYGNDECALRLSKVTNYFSVVSRNHLLAAKQAEITLRHLILPNHVECCSKPILEWIAKNIKEKCIVNLMDQYRPEWNADKYPEINRRITGDEFEAVISYAEKLKLNYIT